MAVGDVGELLGHPGRQPAAGVDQHGEAALAGEREDVLEARVVDPEGLGARMQLDAAGAEVDAALGLGQRILGRG